MGSRVLFHDVRLTSWPLTPTEPCCPSSSASVLVCSAWILYLPSGISTGVLYGGLVILSFLLPYRKGPLIAAAVCSVLDLAGTDLGLTIDGRTPLDERRQSSVQPHGSLAAVAVFFASSQSRGRTPASA